MSQTKRQPRGVNPEDSGEIERGSDCGQSSGLIEGNEILADEIESLKGLSDAQVIVEKDADSLLMIEVSKDSEQALRILIQKWKNPLMNYFYRSISETQTAEDLAQQTFINLYKARAAYTAKAKFSTYLFFIARHLLINEYRRRQRKPADATDPFEMEAPALATSEIELSEIEEFFYKTLEQMPENQKTAILLLKQQELTYDEIAQAMGASVSAVKTWIFRARQTLREAMQAKI